jgi:glycosyltransferase involved in cell wall biosynthesis
MLPLHVTVVPNVPRSLGFGGLEVQLDQTAQALRLRGHTVEHFDWWKPSLETDVVHVFGGFYHHAELVQRLVGSEHRVVVTANMVRIHPAWQYRLVTALGVLGSRTTLGLRGRLLRCAAAVTVASPAERHDVMQLFSIPANRVHVVPNGVEQRFFDATPEAARALLGTDPYVLCVASVEPNKNQQRLISAIGPTGLPLVLVGDPKPSANRAYLDAVQQAVESFPNVRWLRGIDRGSELLPALFAAARVHVLPSLAEAQGLATLEAAAAGCAVVTSDLPTLRSAFTSDVAMCNPTSQQSIRTAVLDAWRNPRSARNAPWLISWQDVAEQLEAVYRA